MNYVVYCDETGHLPCGRAPEMILGALLAPREGVRVRPVYSPNMKKETMLLCPPRSRRAKVARSRVSAINKPRPRLAGKLSFQNFVIRVSPHY